MDSLAERCTLSDLLLDVAMMALLDVIIGYTIEGHKAFDPSPTLKHLNVPNPPANLATRGRRQRWLVDSLAYALAAWLVHRSPFLIAGAILSLHRSVTAVRAPHEPEHATIWHTIQLVVGFMFNQQWSGMYESWCTTRRIAADHPHAHFGISRFSGLTSAQFTIRELTPSGEHVVHPSQPAAEERASLAAELASAADMHADDAARLLSIFHWSIGGLLQGSADGRLSTILATHCEHSDTMIATLAAELYGSALGRPVTGSHLARLACNRSRSDSMQSSDGMNRAGEPEWHDKLPDHHDWRATWIDNTDRRHPGWVLALVDKYPDPVPDVASSASGVMGALLWAQWRWINWKHGEPRNCEGGRLAIFRALAIIESQAEGTNATFTSLAQKLKGQCVGGPIADGQELLCAEYGLVQTAWQQRYGFDAPLSTSQAYTHFLKQWLFNYGPLYASIDATSAVQHYQGGILGHEPATSSARNLSVLVIGYTDNDGIPGGGYWVCLANPQWGSAYGETGCIRVQFGALGVNDAMGFMICRKEAARSARDSTKGHWRSPG